MATATDIKPVIPFEQPGRSGLSRQNKQMRRDESKQQSTARRGNPGAKAEDVPMLEPNGIESTPDLIDALQAENLELRERIAHLEAQLTNKSNPGASEDSESEFARLLEEKTDVIRELHLKIQQLQAEQPSNQETPVHVNVPQEADLVALNEELERERIQLQEDERALMQQMRVLEVQMSRERAELARQRADVERLHHQVQHELELANKEASMRERLQPLMQQRQVLLRNGSALPQRAPKQPEAQPAPAPGTSSGLFRRLFGAG